LSSRLLIVSFSVCPAPDRHGVQLVNVLKALAPRYAVDVLTLRAGMMPFQERFMKTRMLRVPVVGSLGEQVEMFRRAIRRQLEGEEYDVVHLRSAWGGLAVLAGASGKLVYEVARSTEGEPRAADAGLSLELAAEEQLCLERADLVLVPTQSARESLVARGLGRHVQVVPPGVDVDHFDWEPSQLTQLAPRSGATTSNDVPRVLYSGQIAGGRGVRLLMRALARVKQQRPVKLVLAGAIDDGFGPILDDARLETGLDDGDIERLGPIEHDDMPRVIAQATVCVAPSAPGEERPLASFPTKLLEYLACRRAVVAPRRPAVEELITDGETGLLFEPGDDADLARAIGRLLDDPAERERIAEAGYERVRAQQPASATRRRLLEAYAQLLPPSSWTPPTPAMSPIDALPSHPDTTTARRPMPPETMFDSRVSSERSGEIHIGEPPPTPPVPEVGGEIVIEIDADFGELDVEPAGLVRRAAADGDVPADDVYLDDAALEDAFNQTFGAHDAPAEAPVLGFADESADEKTAPRPLRPKNPSG
jgi:glycosyltransferase involved in cell wall biosynthesis